MSHRHPKYNEILTLAQAGNKPEEIAFMLNMNNRQVSEIMYRMRKTGKLPPHTERYSKPTLPVPRKTRRFDRILETLPIEIQSWVMEQIPQGATASDVVRAIIIDAFHESQEHGA